MIGLALDLARRAGWAFGEAKARPYAGVWEGPGFAADKIGQSMASISSSVKAVVQANNVKVFTVEAPLRGITKKNQRGIWTPTSSHGERVLTMYVGAAIAGGVNGGARYVEGPGPQTWRKAVIGVARPEKPKDAAINYCNKIMRWGLIEDDNACEAACILQWLHGVVLQEERLRR